jgi:homocysteine S-methyltransferase
LLLDATDEIVALHAAFFRADAAFATAASRQDSFDGLAASGIDRDTACHCWVAASSWPRTSRDIDET